MVVTPCELHKGLLHMFLPFEEDGGWRETHGCGQVLKPNRIAHSLANRAADFLCYSTSDCHGCHSARLSARYFSSLCKARSTKKAKGFEAAWDCNQLQITCRPAALVEILRNLRCLAATRFSDNYCCGVIFYQIQDLLPVQHLLQTASFPTTGTSWGLDLSSKYTPIACDGKPLPLLLYCKISLQVNGLRSLLGACVSVSIEGDTEGCFLFRAGSEKTRHPAEAMFAAPFLSEPLATLRNFSQSLSFTLFEPRRL